MGDFEITRPRPIQGTGKMTGRTTGPERGRRLRLLHRELFGFAVVDPRSNRV
jgi:hypothetical protein